MSVLVKFKDAIAAGLVLDYLRREFAPIGEITSWRPMPGGSAFTHVAKRPEDEFSFWEDRAVLELTDRGDGLLLFDIRFPADEPYKAHVGAVYHSRLTETVLRNFLHLLVSIEIKPDYLHLVESTPIPTDFTARRRP